ncbi:MAG: flagellar basal body rod protein FlgB [Negativicutes bacterium]|nr:flagellar basal body rod protein FlgB [Negativicutes bacterium]
MIPKLQTRDMPYLEKAIQAGALRNKVIANNVANVNTPNFKRSDVDFQSQLAAALADESGDRLSMAVTSPGHMKPHRQSSRIGPVIFADNSTTMRNDGNNVDIDKEMSNLVENNIYYNAAVNRIAARFAGIKQIISTVR